MMPPKTRFFPLLIAAVAVGSSCTTDTFTAPPPPATHDLSADLLAPTGLLTCSPLPYAFATDTIGPLGGVIDVGPHLLSIPAGALAEPVVITAEAPSDTVNLVRFEPHGLRFAQPASLTMSYANCDVGDLLHLAKQITYVDDALTVLDYLLSSDDIENERVTTELEHFSGYAVAW